MTEVHLPSRGLADTQSAPDVLGEDTRWAELCEAFGELLSVSVRVRITHNDMAAHRRKVEVSKHSTYARVEALTGTPTRRLPSV